MVDERHNPWKTTGSKPMYDNPWISVREDAVVRPDGKDGIYGVVHVKNKAIGILPMDTGEMLHLVGQFRYPLKRFSWEIPEGGCQDDEDPLDAARRELLEETGLTASHWELLGTAHLSNCLSDEESYYYLASGLTQGTASPEGTEVLHRRCIPFQDALQMVRTGQITDAVSVMAILYYELFTRPQPG
jgi:8-oxo-dGTP pyrophosphatase MutT (NUDIX family)